MKYHTLFCRELGKMSQNMSSVAVVIGAFRIKVDFLLELKIGLLKKSFVCFVCLVLNDASTLVGH